MHYVMAVAHRQRVLWCHILHAEPQRHVKRLSLTPRILTSEFFSSGFWTPHDQWLNPSLVSKGALSSEESWKAGSMLILRMFWYFGLDLRWTIQASGKYQADCKILALLLQGITWACLGASLKALNAFHPAAMPLFPGARLSVKLVSFRRKIIKLKLRLKVGYVSVITHVSKTS